MAIYLYRHKIANYAKQGVDFEHSMYVPAIDPLTKQPMHVKETTQKLLKNVARDAKEDKTLSQEFKTRLVFSSTILLAWHGIGKHNKMSRYFLFTSYHNTKL